MAHNNLFNSFRNKHFKWIAKIFDEHLEVDHEEENRRPSENSYNDEHQKETEILGHGKGEIEH